jgi:hypothetical protein
VAGVGEILYQCSVLRWTGEDSESNQKETKQVAVDTFDQC